MTKIEKIIKKIPQTSGVYLFKDKSGRILYVGKAVNLRNRVQSHSITLRLPRKMRGHSGNNIAANQFIDKVANIDWIETEDEKQALLLENDLIKKYQPRYNIQWRDDKSYFWVVFTDDKWPRVKIVHKTSFFRRHPERSEGSPANAGLIPDKLGDSSAYGPIMTDKPIGPFVNGRELRQLLRALQKILPYRTCKNPYDKPCLQWHLGLCPAHDIPYLSPEQAQRARRRLNINPSTSPRFAGLRSGNKLKTYINSLKTLSQFLKLYAREPIRIEAYDISNIHGVWATGSMIVFYGAKAQKSDYHKFKIKTVAGANDVAMIREVLRRRFGHPEWPIPNLILIDGGKAQLRVAQQIANSKSQIEKAKRLAIGDTRPAIVALAKREEEIYTDYSDKSLKLSALPVSLRLTFQAIRNEAHRFAIFYYRHLHEKQYKSRTASKKIRAKS